MSGHNHTFDTDEVRPREPASAQNSLAITTSPAIDFPIGLTLLNFNCERNIRIRSFFDRFEYITSNQTFSATVHLDTWGDSIMYSSACTWLPIFKPDHDFQHGKIVIRPGQPIQKVTFPQEYASIPKVIVWLNGLDIDKNNNWQLHVSATSITTKGFTLNGDVWGGTCLYGMGVTWIAYPASRPNIESGFFNTSEIRDWKNMRHEHSKLVTFNKKFDRPPRVYFALNRIDSDNGVNLRLKAYVDNVTAQQMNIHLDSWSEVNMYSAEGQWLAIQDL